MADARVMPAMAAGVSQTLWSMEEVVRIVDEYEAKLRPDMTAFLPSLKVERRCVFMY
jgi:hypothetical protein